MSGAPTGDLPGWVRDVLRCPACHGELADVAGPGLACTGCGRTYQVRDQIPVLLVDDDPTG